MLLSPLPNRLELPEREALLFEFIQQRWQSDLRNIQQKVYIAREACMRSISRSQSADSNLYLEARGGPLTVPLGAIDTGNGQLTLIDRFGPLTTPGALTGTTVLLFAQGDLTLAHPVTSNGSTTMTLSSGGTLSVQAAVNGHGINMDANSGIDILAPVYASSGLTVTSTGAGTSMLVRHNVTSNGTMNLTLTGGLSVVGDSDQGA